MAETEGAANMPKWVTEEYERIDAEEPGKEHFRPYRLGQGWKYVTKHFESFPNGGHTMGETSEQCILLITSLVCEQVGLDLIKLYRQAYPEEARADVAWLTSLDEARKWTIIPKQVPIQTLLDDIEDINLHSLYAELAEALTEKGYPPGSLVILTEGVRRSKVIAFPGRCR